MAVAKRSLLASGASVMTGATVQITAPAGKENVPCVVRGITTATVNIEGSLDGTNWGVLTTKTADFAGLVPAFPYLRARVTAYTSGTIFVDVWGDKGFG